MASGSFTPPRPDPNGEDFARSAAEGTRAAKGARKHAPTVPPSELATSSREGERAAGRPEGPPAPKKAKKKTLLGSSTPSKGAAVSGGSQTSSSNPIRAEECWVEQPTNPPAADGHAQVPGPRAGNGEENSSVTREVPAHSQATNSEDLMMWQRAPPAAFAQLLREQIEMALDAREQRTAAIRPNENIPRAITSSVGEAALPHYRDPLALQEEEDEEFSPPSQPLRATRRVEMGLLSMLLRLTLLESYRPLDTWSAPGLWPNFLLL
uniref:Uncharacterized protein n=1 Tax=Sphaerodactylus townsendi TaxID=933632 RepID=A0ACB8EC88_9SAUR